MFCLHIYLCTPGVQYLQKPEKGVGTPGSGVTDGCELPCRSWELNLGLPFPSGIFKIKTFLVVKVVVHTFNSLQRWQICGFQASLVFIMKLLFQKTERWGNGVVNTAVILWAEARDTDHSLSQELESQMSTVLKLRNPELDPSPLSLMLFMTCLIKCLLFQ